MVIAVDKSVIFSGLPTLPSVDVQPDLRRELLQVYLSIHQLEVGISQVSGIQSIPQDQLENLSWRDTHRVADLTRQFVPAGEPIVAGRFVELRQASGFFCFHGCAVKYWFRASRLGRTRAFSDAYLAGATIEHTLGTVTSSGAYRTASSAAPNTFPLGIALNSAAAGELVEIADIQGGIFEIASMDIYSTTWASFSARAPVRGEWLTPLFDGRWCVGDGNPAGYARPYTTIYNVADGEGRINFINYRLFCARCIDNGIIITMPYLESGNGFGPL